MKIGVLGTGGIVKAIVPTLKRLEKVQCHAIASRTAERAKQAAEERVKGLYFSKTQP